MNPHYDKIESLGACTPGLEWLAEQGEEWYNDCSRGDWLAWLVAKICDRKRVVLCLCDIAESVQHLDQSGKGQIAINTARSWCNGEATLEEVKTAAARAANAAAAAADAGDVAFAADAAADAAYAAAFAAAAARAANARARDVHADAAADAAYAATADAAYAAAVDAAYAADVADAARDAAYAAADAESLKQFAKIVREHFPWSEVEAKLDELAKGVE